MKKKINLNKKTIKSLKLKLRKPSDRKATPDLLSGYLLDPSNGMSC